MTFLVSLIVGAIVGIVGFVRNLPSQKEFKLGSKGGFWQPVGAAAQKKLLWRGKLAISPRNWLLAFPMLGYTILLPLVLLVIFWFSSPDVLMEGFGGLLGILFGTFIAGLVAYPLGFGRRLREYRRDVAFAGAKMLARLDDTQLAGDLLAAAAQQKDSNLRLAAIVGFRELGQIQHVDKLEVLCNDSNMQVKQNALQTVQHLQKMLVQKPLSVLQLRPLFNDHWTLQRKIAEASTGSSLSKFEELYVKNQRRFEEILDSQLPLWRSFPHLYCQECYAFTEKQSAWDWEWLRCTNCQDAVHLVTGVERITGQIGGSTTWNLSEGQLQVQLWDAAARSARSGRISTLEIIGGQTIDYDWAVSAVVEKLHNENPDYGKAIRVVLVGEPALAANTVKLLRDLDSQFVDEK